MNTALINESGARRRTSRTVAAEPRAEGLQERYLAQVARVRRMGDWLMGPEGDALSEDEWETRFRRYMEETAELRRLAAMLRPASLRERQEVLAGEALQEELLELFAA